MDGLGKDGIDESGSLGCIINAPSGDLASDGAYVGIRELCWSTSCAILLVGFLFFCNFVNGRPAKSSLFSDLTVGIVGEKGKDKAVLQRGDWLHGGWGDGEVGV